MDIFYHPNGKDYVNRWQEKFELIPSPELPVGYAGYYLYYDGKRLRLYHSGDSKGICLRDSMVQKRSNIRNRLAKACGLRQNVYPEIIDGTGGLGMDAMTLTSIGCDMHVFERNTSLWAMIDDYIKIRGIRISSLHNEDSFDWVLGRRKPCCDVLYLDPFFPERSKSSLPKKEMQYVRDLCANEGSDTRWSDFIGSGGMGQLASLVRQRIVLKRRLKDPVLDSPSWQIKGKIVRYDVYRGNNSFE